MDLRKRHPPSFSIAWNVAARTPLVALDARVATWLHEHASDGLTAFLLAVTHLNSLGAISAWSVLFAVVLARLRESLSDFP